jgi:hypothetical protein
MCFLKERYNLRNDTFVQPTKQLINKKFSLPEYYVKILYSISSHFN